MINEDDVDGNGTVVLPELPKMNEIFIQIGKKAMGSDFFSNHCTAPSAVVFCMRCFAFIALFVCVVIRVFTLLCCGCSCAFTFSFVNCVIGFVTFVFLQFNIYVFLVA